MAIIYPLSNGILLGTFVEHGQYNWLVLNTDCIEGKKKHYG